MIAIALTIFAASSLREAFTDLARQFERQHAGVHVALDFAGSQELRLQIENGAAADVFASADEQQMARLKRPCDAFAHNEPVLVVPADDPAGLRAFEDLPRARRVVLGAPEVPIGAYSLQILKAAGMLESVEPHVVSRELNVRQVLAKVALGEADAGIVYRTDAVAAGVRAIPIPPRINPIASYCIAALTGAPLAREFVALVRSPAGRIALEARGFSP